MPGTSNSIPSSGRAGKSGRRSVRPIRGASGWGRLLSSVALLVFVLAGTEFYAVRKTHELMQTGVDDHIHCAIEGTYPRQKERAEMVTALGPYSPMLQPIIDQFNGDAVVSAHRCTVNGRSYVHMIFRRDQTLISVILTKREKADAYPRAIGMRVFDAAGIPVHTGDLAGYSVAGFEAGDYLGYVISELPGQQNDRLAGQVAPVIRRYTGA